MNLVLIRNILAVVLVILIILILTPSGIYVVKPADPIPSSDYLGDHESPNTGEFLVSPVRYFVNSIGNLAFGVNRINSNYLTVVMSYFIPNSKRVQLTDFIAKDTDAEMYSEYLERSTIEGEIFVKAAVLDYLNESFNLTGEGVVVGALSQDSYLGRYLAQGDVILRLGESDIETTFDLVKAKRNVSDIYDITFDSPTGVYTVQVEKEGSFGLFPYTKNISLESKKEIDVDVVSATGTSGGLMISLEILSSILGEDLTKGKLIAGSGSISPDGSVRGVENIGVKVIGSKKYGADIFLAPLENYNDLKGRDFGDIEIIYVESLKEAVRELRKLE